MPAFTRGLFDETTAPALPAFVDAFESWLAAREQFGSIRQASSVAVYRSMWSALSSWCVSRGLHLDDLRPEHYEAYLHSRGGADDLSARYAWRLLMLADAVQTHRARTAGVARNAAAQELLLATPEWRYANAASRTPLPDHLQAAQARALVLWLLDPAHASDAAGAPAQAWQSLRNRVSVAMQLGAGLTPGDIRAATVGGVVCEGGRVASVPWKIRLPMHGSIPAREAPVAPWAGRLLRTWLDTRVALQVAGPVLFPATRKGRPWGKVAQYAAAKAVLDAAGVPDTEGGSFMLRHTFALRQLRRGTDPEQVAQWMGLRDVAALARYRRVLVAVADVV